MTAPMQAQRIPGNEGESMADRLIATYIEPHPATMGVANYRLKEDEGGYPVWAIIGDLTPGLLSPDEILAGFHISRPAFDAVLVFYMRHKEAVDARVAANRLD